MWGAMWVFWAILMKLASLSELDHLAVGAVYCELVSIYFPSIG